MSPSQIQPSLGIYPPGGGGGTPLYVLGFEFSSIHTTANPTPGQILTFTFAIIGLGSHNLQTCITGQQTPVIFLVGNF